MSELPRKEQRDRRPIHPGKILQKEFLEPAGLTQRDLAQHIGYGTKAINRLVNEHTRVTPEMAQKLGAAFKVSPQFWLNLQQAVDLYETEQEITELPRPIIESKNNGPNKVPVR